MDNFYVLHDPADQAWAVELTEKLGTALKEWNTHELWTLDRIPEVTRLEGFDRLPRPEAVGPLGLVLLVLPGRDFTVPEALTIERFRTSPGARSQILPVASDETRNVPRTPLEKLVSFRLHNGRGGAGCGGNADVAINDTALRRLVVWLLIQVGLRASEADRKIFISYRAKDGLHAAKALAAKLRERGFEAFRDEDLDKDEQTLLAPGVDAQKKLHEKIRTHSILLLVDTPLVTESEWVKEEVETALNYLKTIVPVVVDPGGRKVKAGGRIRGLNELEIEVRVDGRALSADPVDLDAVFDDARLNKLEEVMLGQLLGQLRVRKTLVPATEAALKKMGFTSWNVVSKDRLVFETELQAYPGDGRIPSLCLRLLVQCWPYDWVLDYTVRSMSRLVRARSRDRHCQYGVMVHSGKTDTNRLQLLENSGGHLMILEPGEFEKLPLIPERALT